MYGRAKYCSGKTVPGRTKKWLAGGNIISTKKNAVSNYKQGGIAKGCGNVLEK
jgi:hypothetical protein